jgi:hypothetical protein
MPARKSARENATKSIVENAGRRHRYAAGGVSMRDLLASCAAADAVSRPPHVPKPADPRTARGHHRAA